MLDRDELSASPIRPVAKGTPGLAPPEIAQLLTVVGNGWEVEHGKKLGKTYRFDDFAKALAFVNQVGNLAEQVEHHPDIELGWGRARIEIWTHSVGGLHRIDFVFAARCDHLFAGDASTAEP
jgi:4a-hydroxytetrahydrobiopterin dehydratase